MKITASFLYSWLLNFMKNSKFTVYKAREPSFLEGVKMLEKFIVKSVL